MALHAVLAQHSFVHARAVRGQVVQHSGRGRPRYLNLLHLRLFAITTLQDHQLDQQRNAHASSRSLIVLQPFHPARERNLVPFLLLPPASQPQLLFRNQSKTGPLIDQTKLMIQPTKRAIPASLTD